MKFLLALPILGICLILFKRILRAKNQECKKLTGYNDFEGFDVGV